jgi:outer membrane lipoprotein SlyB
MNARRLSTCLGATALALVTACSTAPRRDPYADAPVYQSQPVYTQPQPVYSQPQPGYSQSNAYAQYGQVRAIEVVPVETRTSGGGAVLGAVLGAVVGNQFGSGTGRAAATGVGAVGGAVAGNAIEKRQRRDNEAYRVSVRFEDGSVRDFDFQRVDDLQVGDRVKWDGGQLTRM